MALAAEKASILEVYFCTVPVIEQLLFVPRRIQSGQPPAQKTICATSAYSQQQHAAISHGACALTEPGGLSQFWYTAGGCSSALYRAGAGEQEAEDAFEMLRCCITLQNHN